MSKKLFLFLVLMLLMPILFVKAQTLDNYVNTETGYKAVIEDDANLLKDYEINNLYDEMSKLTKYGNIIFKSIESNYDTTDSYARDYYHDNYGTRSGTLFLIDMNNREIYIFSDGSNYKIITSAKAYIITDNTYRYATNKNYYKCASVAFSQVNTLLEGGKISEPMRYITNALAAIVIASLINFIIVLITTSIKKADNKELMSNCNIKFNTSNIDVTKTGTHRVYSPVSESSGGGGSSGSGGGGGSSGGGGGHSF